MRFELENPVSAGKNDGFRVIALSCFRISCYSIFIK